MEHAQAEEVIDDPVEMDSSEDLIGPTQPQDEDKTQMEEPATEAESEKTATKNGEPESDKSEKGELENDENVDSTNVITTEATEEKEEKLYQFPLGRVKHIMKMDPDVNMASQDAVFLITKSIELFVESLALESYSYTVGAKKKTISKQDVEKAIDSVDALAFLDGALDD
jgi:DNA polymerase epsilon subunit 4